MITVLFAILCFFFMPNTPADAKFLTHEERSHALARMRLDAHGAAIGNVDDEHFDWFWVKMALKAPQTYFNAIIWFFLLVPLYVSARVKVRLDANALESPKYADQLITEFLAVSAYHHQRNGLSGDHCSALHRPAQYPSVLVGDRDSFPLR